MNEPFKVRMASDAEMDQIRMEDDATARQRIKDLGKERLARYEHELDSLPGMTVIRAANTRKSKSIRDQLIALRDELDGMIKEQP